MDRSIFDRRAIANHDEHREHHKTLYCRAAAARLSRVLARPYTTRLYSAVFALLCVAVSISVIDINLSATHELAPKDRLPWDLFFALADVVR